MKILAFVLLAVIYAVSYSFYNIVFDSGDDIGMQKIIQGYFTGTPDVHLVFINVIIGYILKPFYNLDNSIYWYSLMMVGFQAASFWIILKTELRKKYHVVYYIALLLLFQYFIIRLQFTTVSAVLTIAGFLMLKDKLQSGKKNLLLPLIFFYLGYLVRDDMFFLAMAFLLVFTFLQDRALLFDSLKKRAYIVQFSVFLLALVAANWIDNQHYQTKEWKYYTDYNDVRGRLNDSPMFRAFYENEYFSDKLKKSDLDLFTLNFTMLQNYDAEKLREIYKESRADANSWTYKIKCLRTNAIQKNNFVLYLFIAFILLFTLKQRKFSLLVPVFLLIAVFVYISLDMTFKNRLSFSVLLVFFLFYASEVNRKWYSVLAAAFAVTLIYTNKTFFIGLSEMPKIEVAQLPSDKMIIPLNSTLTTFHPFKLNEINSQKNVVNLGWLSESPLLISKLKQSNINVSQHFTLYDDKNTNALLYYFINKKTTFKLFSTNLQMKGMKFVPVENYKDVYTIEKL